MHMHHALIEMQLLTLHCSMVHAYYSTLYYSDIHASSDANWLLFFMKGELCVIIYLFIGTSIAMAV